MIPDTGCAECNRRELAVHVAKVDLESAERSIRALQEQVKALKARLEKKKGKGQDEPVSDSLVGSDDERS